MNISERVKAFSSLVVLPHSVFALPFALASLLVATQGKPPLPLLGWVILAMFLARTTAMAYNRLVDADIDAKNPRTQGRDIPKGRVKPLQARILVWVCGLGFVGVCSFINALAFKLSPLVLGVLLFYSHTKRFTWGSHFFLGFALGLAPVGAWIAALGRITLEPFFLTAAVTCFVAGFDILYALQDEAFDRKEGLYSWAVKWGPRSSVWASRFLHVGMIGFLAGFAVVCGFPSSHFTLLGLVAAGLAWLHRMGYRLEGQGKETRVTLSPMMMATNGWIAVLYLAVVAATLYSTHFSRL